MARATSGRWCAPCCPTPSPSRRRPIVVIAGGIDLSVASMMALTSVTAAVDDGRAPARSSRCWSCRSCLSLGLVLGAINGILIVVTRVPDIVVTLATLFVLQGAALLVLDAPGGAAAEWLKALIVGTVADAGRARRRSPPGAEGAAPASRLPRHRLDPAAALAARPVDLRDRQQRARRLPQRRAGRAHQDRRLCAGRACSPPWAG